MWFWLILTLLLILTQSFYSMVEMAAVSFDKVRLQYYISKGNKRAIWLNSLLQKPSQLFTTTLMGVNIALQMGSESSREFYAHAGLDPDLAPLTQVILVLVLAELAPMFAARRHAEHVAMLGIPIVYATSTLLTPINWVVGFIARFANRLVGGKQEEINFYLSRDELQKVLEEQDEGASSTTESRELTTTAANIFSFHNKVASQIMIPLGSVQMISSHCTVGQMRDLLKEKDYPYFPMYSGSPSNIISIAIPRDLLRISDNRRVRDYARPHWFITEDAPLVQILKQFRRNNQNIAVVLDKNGLAQGILTLEDLVDQIFGTTPQESKEESNVVQLLVERTFSAEMLIADFNREFAADLSKEGAETLGELVIHLLGHNPHEGESARTGHYELTVKETTLLEPKTISVKTLLE